MKQRNEKHSVEEKDSVEGKDSVDEKDSDVRRILNLAGRRSEPPAEIRDRVFDNVLTEWQQLPEKKKFSFRLVRPQVLAASLIITLITFAGGWKMLLGGEEVYVGELVFSSGQFAILGDKQLHDNFLSDGVMIHTGEDGRLSIRLLKRTEVRLDVNTQISFRKNAELWLHSGRIYIDSPGADEGVKVVTPFGPVSDIGTQFTVNVASDEVEVAVREGLVNIALDSGNVSINADDGGAERITINKDDEVNRSQVSNNDVHWGWIHLAAAEFKLDNSSVHAFLQWASRESGLKLIFENDHALMAAKQTRLHGSLDGMNPRESIAVILSTTRFGSRVTEKQELIVQIKP